MGDIERYKFERTARSLFSTELPDYGGFRKALEFVSGLRCVVNLESIRRMGPEAWVAEARRFWFGSDADDPPSSE